jgi:hypothetical protein
MKTKQFLFTCALLIAVTLSSCKKDKNDSNNSGGTGAKNQVTYTIDGGTFNHQLITINSDPKALENGAVSGSLKYLKINLDDAAADNTTGPKWALDIAFNKVGTGTANVNDPITNSTLGADKRVYFLLQVQVNGQTKYLTSSITAPGQTPGTITVTKFESVGGTVEGTFEGTLLDDNVTYTITKGHFVVTRKA